MALSHRVMAIRIVSVFLSVASGLPTDGSIEGEACVLVQQRVSFVTATRDPWSKSNWTSWPAARKTAWSFQRSLLEKRGKTHRCGEAGNVRNQSADSLLQISFNDTDGAMRHFIEGVIEEHKGRIIDYGKLDDVVRSVVHLPFRSIMEKLRTDAAKPNPWLLLSKMNESWTRAMENDPVQRFKKHKFDPSADGPLHFPTNVGRFAPLNQHGYLSVMSFESDREMRFFIVRIVRKENFTITDPDGLDGFVPWFSGSCAAQSYPTLLAKLRHAGKNSLWIAPAGNSELSPGSEMLGKSSGHQNVTPATRSVNQSVSLQRKSEPPSQTMPAERSRYHQWLESTFGQPVWKSPSPINWAYSIDDAPIWKNGKMLDDTAAIAHRKREADWPSAFAKKKQTGRTEDNGSNKDAVVNATVSKEKNRGTEPVKGASHGHQIGVENKTGPKAVGGATVETKQQTHAAINMSKSELQPTDGKNHSNDANLQPQRSAENVSKASNLLTWKQARETPKPSKAIARRALGTTNKNMVKRLAAHRRIGSSNTSKASVTGSGKIARRLKAKAKAKVKTISGKLPKREARTAHWRFPKKEEHKLRARRDAKRAQSKKAEIAENTTSEISDAQEREQMKEEESGTEASGEDSAEEMDDQGSDDARLATESGLDNMDVSVATEGEKSTREGYRPRDDAFEQRPEGVVDPASTADAQVEVERASSDLDGAGAANADSSPQETDPKDEMAPKDADGADFIEKDEKGSVTEVSKISEEKLAEEIGSADEQADEDISDSEANLAIKKTDTKPEKSSGRLEVPCFGLLLLGLGNALIM